MNKKVFISGSISIKNLPADVQRSLDDIISGGLEILVGDAKGVDTLIQTYCSKACYFNVTVYSVYDIPRIKISKEFRVRKIHVDENIKKETLRQQEKDKAMTADCDYCFVIWDEKSKGSYANILRAIDYQKKIKIYLARKNMFLENNRINKSHIEYIYRESNGFTASEVVSCLKNKLPDYFKSSKDLYKYLIKRSMLRKKDNIYIPTQENIEFFIVSKYRGRAKGVKFKNEFIEWIEKEIKNDSRNRNDNQLTLL